MFLSGMRIRGYKGFNKEISVSFNQGLNILVGENASGKSAIIDAVRLLLMEDELSRSGIKESDFYRDYLTDEVANEISITGKFSGLSPEEKSIYLPWLDQEFNALLNLNIQNKVNGRGNYKKEIWGGRSTNSIFEWELLTDISCIYLPPLRDAESKLKAGRSSRLARLLKNLNADELNIKRQTGEKHELEKEVQEFNDNLISKNTISVPNKLINKSMQNALGNVFAQSTKIQFAETSFEKISESLQLLFAPTIGDSSEKFRELSQNSLGYNNLIYISTILAEFEGLSNVHDQSKILLIEEPEAHLHPQLQIRLLKYLDEVSKNSEIQIIVTTHSPSITSAVPIDRIKVLSRNNKSEITYINIAECGIEEKSKKFLNRWLDITKSVLFFSKGVILVEGLAEAILIPKLAEIVIRNKKKYFEDITFNALEDVGVSIINMNGIYFEHFMSLYKGYELNYPNLSKEKIKNFKLKNFYEDYEYKKTEKIPVRCVGITDNDPEKLEAPSKGAVVYGKNPSLYLTEQLKKMTTNCRLFSNLKTFEYDLALENGNLKIMIETYLELLETDGDNRTLYEEILKTKKYELEEEVPTIAFELLKRIDDLGKGPYAQELYNRLYDINSVQFNVPIYIKEAIEWILWEDKYE